jgi:hypothetical protein
MPPNEAGVVGRSGASSAPFVARPFADPVNEDVELYVFVLY